MQVPSEENCFFFEIIKKLTTSSKLTDEKFLNLSSTFYKGQFLL